MDEKKKNTCANKRDWGGRMEGGDRKVVRKRKPLAIREEANDVVLILFSDGVCTITKKSTIQIYIRTSTIHRYP